MTAIERYLLSRRDLLRGAGGLSAYAVLPDLPSGGDVIRLRLLETSDLHMFIYDYDYYRDRPDPTLGFAKTAQLIAEARGQAPNCLLFDNGDTIQGNPLSDFVASGQSVPTDGVHPMFRVMNMLRYDAATLGNHEFNYGLDFLGKATAGAHFPILSANITWTDGRPYAPPFAILERDLIGRDGRRHRLKIGVIGFLPPQITVWDKARLQSRVETQDIVAAAERYVPALRRRCDLLIALCHSGIGTVVPGGRAENAALQLAAVRGIDAVFTGHSHRVFPGPDYAGIPGVDAERGTLAGIPAVMPGFWGSHLGVIDLNLQKQGTEWAVAGFSVEARPIYRRDGSKVVSLADDDQAVLTAAAPEHEAAKAYVGRPIGTFSAPVTSYFSFVADDASLALISQAQLSYVKPLLAGTEHASLPLLSAASAMKAGPAPDAYTDIAAGPVALRNIADLYTYPNLVTAVRVNGVQIREWLERSAAFFDRLDPTVSELQKLISGRHPAYNFDVIAGLTYAIDVTQPARYDQSGRFCDPTAWRVTDIRLEGRPLADDQEVIVVTNNYRAAGGGNFPDLNGANTILQGPDTNRDAIIAYVERMGTIDPKPLGVWRFVPPDHRLTATFESSPVGRSYLSAYPSIHYLAEAAGGLARYAIDLG
ncbi:bifunctional 2',3'-cyclic-nucleotide 2'-phosphodiesterase/3'-nucleotidase [Telmatospirillum sp.]|uniref:bifunctional 2',3'-cyclic-nucleotide 2'-phosphodiesterase/3'-nucleotidase n=1 Tax=Telmatospirillum sp. TaxID=2079197 RepID=UPI002843FA57|nr:bifunctional 2',3'-cyclic-nucleotide 2'-phosphodiesterase/3'-nucleotidase [Telmatospirillum sp.]MDR3436875.1 bifunctional 2',3'-cyclic-nucleotide 2'-phosphodiesterase/3'-nucleotidase [Telmatospirillum sp.]